MQDLVIDWSKAPEWADKHGFIGLGRQPVWFNSSRYVYVDGQQGGRDFLFAGNGFQRGSASGVTSRPTTPSWSGEGLPPVGLDIQVRHELYGWIGAQVVGQDGEAAIVRTNDGYAGVFPRQMRPIRTPEQIAAEEREAAVDEMVNDATNPMDERMLFEKYPGDAFVRELVGCLYSAGYRKP